jgi:uncharacterized membrane protein YoaK (UPF0700 family)
VPETRESQSVRAKAAVALFLTFASGNVDILGFVGIYQLFTAHITGSSVELAHSLVRGNWTVASIAAVLVASFFLGSIIGRAIIEAGARLKVRKIATVTLGLEAVIVAGIASAGPVILGNHSTANGVSTLTVCVLIGALAAAMGLQTATLTGVGPLTVHTTFVTGMINKLAQVTSHMLFGAYDLLRKSPADQIKVRSKLREDRRKAAFLFGIWIAYVAGAALGSFLHRPWGLRAMYVSVVLLLVAIAADQIWGLSRAEEKEQSEA